MEYLKSIRMIFRVDFTLGLGVKSSGRSLITVEGFRTSGHKP